MPLLGLGTWQLTKDTAETIEAAIALGGDYGTQPGIAPDRVEPVWLH